MLQSKIITLLGMMFILMSCSSLVESTRKSLLGEDSPRKAKKEVKWVSKVQYDDLLTRYKNLKDRYDKLKDDKLNGDSSYNQMEEMAANGQGSNDETIDVFAKGGLANQVQNSGSKNSAPAPQLELQNLNNSDIEDELKVYKKGIALKLNGKIDESLKVFQYLERSKSEQIRVRAKNHIGNIYMDKSQFDLALQVNEAIITNYAFSGKVIDALKNAVICCEKLGLTDKKLKYQSILRDFFEIKA